MQSIQPPESTRPAVGRMRRRRMLTVMRNRTRRKGRKCLARSFSTKRAKRRKKLVAKRSLTGVNVTAEISNVYLK